MTNTRSLRLKRLVVGLSAALALVGVETPAFALSLTKVTNCADDSSLGTLRQVVAGAASGTEIDMSGLSCIDSTITLTQGEVAIPHNVTLFGPSDRTLSITNSNGRVLHSTSTDNSSYLGIINLSITGGRVYTKNTDADGGCILAAGNVALVGSTVSDCVAHASAGNAYGGAINAKSVSLQSSGVFDSGAYAVASYQVARGGAIYASSLSCTDGTLSGNHAAAASTGDYGQGGGAFVAGGNAVLLRCTVDSNHAGEGGGIAQFLNGGSSSVTTIQNSTISGNTATNIFGGVEVFCIKCSPSPLQLINSTVAFNSSSRISAGIFTNGTVIAQSSIVANNRTAQVGDSDLFASGLSGANNLIVSTNATPAAGVITITSDPMLTPLASHGGATRVHALSLGSPARDQGNNSALIATDQRGNGFDRMTSGTVDIGAYERQSNDEVVFGGGFD